MQKSTDKLRVANFINPKDRQSDFDMKTMKTGNKHPIK